MTTTATAATAETATAITGKTATATAATTVAKTATATAATAKTATATAATATTKTATVTTKTLGAPHQRKREETDLGEQRPAYANKTATSKQQDCEGHSICEAPRSTPSTQARRKRPSRATSRLCKQDCNKQATRLQQARTAKVTASAKPLGAPPPRKREGSDLVEQRPAYANKTATSRQQDCNKQARKHAHSVEATSKIPDRPRRGG